MRQVIPDPVDSRAELKNGIFEAVSGNENCGPYFKVIATVDQLRISNCQYLTIPCIWTSVIGNLVVSWVMRYSKDKWSLHITPQNINDLVEGIPLSKINYVQLAVSAVARLHKALPDNVHHF